MCGPCSFPTRLDCVLKRFAIGVVLRRETRLLDKFPPACNEVQVWRRRRSGPELHGQFLCHGLYPRTPLIASVVQHDGHRDAWRWTSQPASQLTNRFRGTIRQILDGKDFVCDRVQSRQHIHALTARRRFDKQPFNPPDHPHDRGQHEMGRIHQEDGALAGLGVSSPRRQSLVLKASWAATSAVAGSTPTRRGRLPSTVQTWRTCVGVRAMPGRASMLAAAAATVAGGGWRNSASIVARWGWRARRGRWGARCFSGAIPPLT